MKQSYKLTQLNIFISILWSVDMTALLRPDCLAPTARVTVKCPGAEQRRRGAHSHEDRLHTVQNFA